MLNAKFYTLSLSRLRDHTIPCYADATDALIDSILQSPIELITSHRFITGAVDFLRALCCRLELTPE